MSREKAPVVVLAFVALALLPCLAVSSPATSQQDPREIIDRVDRLMRGESSHGKSTMEVVTEHWTRSLSMEIWSLGTEHSLIRVTAPAKEAGTATLKADKDIWNYLPKVDRTIKIPASMMSGSWMGSHFTNDDLVKDSRLIDQYDIEISFEGERDGETRVTLVDERSGMKYPCFPPRPKDDAGDGGHARVADDAPF